MWGRHDELLLDGTPALNLASFVTTYQEPEAEQLMMENLSKNFIDVEEYPSCGEIETRCVNIVVSTIVCTLPGLRLTSSKARLFNAPLHSADEEALGVSTIGSSEAIILAVLAAKKRWQIKRRAEGKSTENPNVVMNSAVQGESPHRYLSAPCSSFDTGSLLGEGGEVPRLRGEVLVRQGEPVRYGYCRVRRPRR